MLIVELKMNEQEETEEMTIEGPEVVAEEPEEVETSRTKIVITEEAFLEALEKVGGEAKITPLYEAFNKTAYPNVAPAKLKTALRVAGKKLAEKSKVQAVHVNEKRTFTFKTV